MFSCNRIERSGGIALAFLLAAASGFSYPALFVYGDSLSDTGKIAAPSPQYFNGRWSNGSVWVEYLSVRLGLAYNSTNNYAYAGTTTSSLATEVGFTPVSTNLQLGLSVVWSGGNDFLNNLHDGVYDDASWSNVIASAVANLTNAANSLYNKGARSVLLCNLPDLGKIPDLLNSYSSPYQAYISSKVVLFNSALSAGVAQLRPARPDLHLYLVDVYSRYASLLNAPANLGFTVATVGALDDTNLMDKSFTGPGSNYVFWDSVHPTTKAHSLIAGWAFQSLPVAPPVEIAGSRNASNLNLLLQNLTPGSSYTVQSTTNLVTWLDYQTITAVGSNQTVTATLGLAKEFFRVRF